MESILGKLGTGRLYFLGLLGPRYLIGLFVISAAGYLSTGHAAGSAPPEDEDSKSELVVFAEDISLTIQPKRCLLRASHSNCEASILLSWKADKKFSLCLREKGDSLDLACWDNSISGAAKIRFEGNQTTFYQLVDAEAKTIAEVAFTVSQVATTHRKVMSRKRRMWGFP